RSSQRQSQTRRRFPRWRRNAPHRRPPPHVRAPPPAPSRNRKSFAPHARPAQRHPQPHPQPPLRRPHRPRQLHPCHRFLHGIRDPAQHLRQERRRRRLRPHRRNRHPAPGRSQHPRRPPAPYAPGQRQRSALGQSQVRHDALLGRPGHLLPQHHPP